MGKNGQKGGCSAQARQCIGVLGSGWKVLKRWSRGRLTRPSSGRVVRGRLSRLCYSATNASGGLPPGCPGLFLPQSISSGTFAWKGCSPRWLTVTRSDRFYQGPLSQAGRSHSRSRSILQGLWGSFPEFRPSIVCRIGPIEALGTWPSWKTCHQKHASAFLKSCSARVWSTGEAKWHPLRFSRGTS